MPELLAGLTLTGNDVALPRSLGSRRVQVVPGAAGLATIRVVVEFTVRLPVGRCRVEFADTNFPGRVGWREVVVRGPLVLSSDAPALDLSEVLTVYPPEVLPLSRERARVVVSVPETAANPAALPSSATAETVDEPTLAGHKPTPPPDEFASLFAQKLTPRLILFGLLLAFVFGSQHAFAPGHGKAMVAAYLVGSRGTFWDALVLGLTVTVTHTAGVFAAGVLILFASRWFVPEQLNTALGVLSGLSICVVGMLLIRSRLTGAPEPFAHEHSHDHDHSAEQSHSHEHSHSAEHSHEHNHNHEHSHSHNHGRQGLGALIALGVSGGIVPCPTALVVLLAAVGLNQTLLGIGLLVAFSLGLAATLTAVGVAVVYFQSWLERIPGGSGRLGWLSLLSAFVVTGLGVALVIRTLATA